MGEANGNSGRMAGGLFAPGNRIAKGNPQAKRMRELRRAFLDAADDADIGGMAKTLIAQAKGGDVQAARLALEYLLGKPVQAVELSGPEGEPLDLKWAEVQAVILNTLSDVPELRYEVAAKLRGLVDAGGNAE